MKEKLALHPQKIRRVLLAFLVLAIILFIERNGVAYRVSARLTYLDADQVMTTQQAMAGSKAACLLVVDSSNPASVEAEPDMKQILLDMRLAYDTVDLHTSPLPDLTPYSRLIYTSSLLDTLGESLLELNAWVQNGGNAMFAQTLDKTSYLDVAGRWLGIIQCGYDRTMVRSMELADGFMIGGQRDVCFADAYDAALEVALDDEAVVYARTADTGVPLIWAVDQGLGRYVVCNFGYSAKATRGFYSSAITLMEEYTVYPVINSATWYLDDFPAPVPSGSSEYITRDYNCSTAHFFRNYWWQDLMSLASKHGIRFTGMVIETYEDKTDGTIEKASDTSSFQYFGNMLLHLNGEIGFHGYNHQPLILEGTLDYRGEMPYNTWPALDTMRESLKALKSFTRELFPIGEQSVYVPPSNILAAEGRQVLVEDETVRCIASTLLEGSFAYTQEFGVAADGMVEAPRTISGCLLDEYDYMAAVSELNLHYVSSHFMHPDDVLDEDRGAELGWEELCRRLSEYMDWLYTSAPNIRNLTGSEQAGAIERFSALAYTTGSTENGMRITLTNLYDDAYLIVRFNGHTPASITGGTLENLTGNLYLLNAKESVIEIRYAG